MYDEDEEEIATSPEGLFSWRGFKGEGVRNDV